MAELWAYRVENGLNTLDEVPDVYREEVEQILSK